MNEDGLFQSCEDAPELCTGLAGVWARRCRLPEQKVEPRSGRVLIEPVSLFPAPPFDVDPDQDPITSSLAPGFQTGR